ncbi:MAG TPA: hypothetical protein VNP96_01830 [Solirubrobacterales bacterium]|nr:hypothetical protein [Solirubrobacterales bacterium]
MNLILILKELWHRRALVALSIFVAAAISVLAVFQVSLAPPSVSKRAKVEAEGSIELLVDSARSPIADARRDLTGLTARAAVFARYISGGNVIGEIAKANDIPVKRIDVAGAAPLPGQVPGIEEAPQLNPYGISIVQSGELPILTIFTRAPTVREARGMAAAAPSAIRKVVESIQAEQGTPLTRRVEFRALGPAQAALVDDTIGKKVAAVLFLVLLTIFIVAILAVPRLVAAWRDAEPQVEAAPQPVDEPEDESEAAPNVVRL